ncbi:ATP-grasp domain-containing protein [Nocardia noduli]|uniref:ATP-grasp domain-containing protein n=1 Tax=Nocardia noduli TaxID=2815722 RepID=UPI001C2322B7|nr:ATP-grasp domain-containing protein [Nocardia noduli]
MITTAYLQGQGPRWLRHEERLLAEGLGRLGIPIRFYVLKRIQRRQLPLGPETMVAGDMDAMHGAMSQLRIPIPHADDYPASLREYLRRTVWTSTLGEVERALEAGMAPTFVKPARRRKNFTGTVCYSERDIAALGNISRRQEVWCSEIVTWIAEFRVYVIDRRIVTVSRYSGDRSISPDMNVIESAIATYHDSGTAPIAYGIDFGVLNTGETALVEVNDGYALGAYEIDADLYTELVTRRWSELLTTAES